MSDQKTPMDIMREVCPEGMRSYMQQRADVLENPELQALSKREKLLIGIGVAASLQSSLCTLMWTKMARQAGVTKDEIAESILVSRLMKAATVNDTSAEALSWLANETGGGK